MECPANWDNILNGHWNRDLQPDSRESNRFRFEGLGYDEEKFHMVGYIHPLTPQHGVPGWYRVAMMKFFMNKDKKIVAGTTWAYEGVMLPGGQMIVGRWWAPDTMRPGVNVYSGPFIYWNVDSSLPEEKRGPDSEGGFDNVPLTQAVAITSALLGDGHGYNMSMDYLQNAYDSVLARNRLNGVDIVDTEVNDPTDLLFIDLNSVAASSAGPAYTNAVNYALPPPNQGPNNSDDNADAP